MVSQAAVEACSTEALEDGVGTSDSDSDRHMLVADALHTILQATANAFPVNAGGLPLLREPAA